MARPLPIKFQELLSLANVGVDSSAIGFNSCVCRTRAGHLVLTHLAPFLLTRA